MVTAHCRWIVREWLAVLAICAFACRSTPEDGAPSTTDVAGGQGTGLGGASARGGSTSASGAATGGATAGGATASGGAIAAGGSTSAGGATVGGATATGGAITSGGATAGANAAGTAGVRATGGAGAGGGLGLPPITDYSGLGPFPTMTDSNAGPGGKYTIFRPAVLGENGFRHAPIIFGPGINTDIASYTKFLSNVASHGFVVVAVNALTSGPSSEANRTPMLNGLDWIIAQNTTAGIYQGKLDVTHAVSMGYSIGGTAAVEIGGHAAVTTVVSIHGHAAKAALRGPLLQTTGTQDTAGLPLQQQTYDMSQTQTFLATLTGAGHFYIVDEDGGGAERPPIVAWLRYWIYGDVGAKHYFYGNDCTLCTAPWEKPQRKNWQ